jgi:hypothetical protein
LRPRAARLAGGGAAVDHRDADIVAGLERHRAVGRVIRHAEAETAPPVALGGELVLERDRLVRLLGPAGDDQHAGQHLGAANADMRGRRREAGRRQHRSRRRSA